MYQCRTCSRVVKAAGNNQDAHFFALIGATGCGKTYELKRQLKKRKCNRLLIWSPKEKIDNYAALYPKTVTVRTVSGVLEVLRKAGKTGAFRIVFIPTLNQKKDTEMFSTVCKLLMAVGNLVLIVEELHTVTTASHAPDGWRHVCFMGRGMGIHVYGLSQRPASVDKAFMGSLSGVYVGRLPEEPDQKVMAGKLRVDYSEVANLLGFQSISRNMLTGETTRKL